MLVVLPTSTNLETKRLVFSFSPYHSCSSMAAIAALGYLVQESSSSSLLVAKAWMEGDLVIRGSDG